MHLGLIRESVVILKPIAMRLLSSANLGLRLKLKWFPTLATLGSFPTHFSPFFPTFQPVLGGVVALLLG